MKVGDMFGMRTLLDTGNCQKYLQHNLIRFSEQLNETPEEYYDHYRELDRKANKIAEAVKTQLRFCRECYENRVECQHGLEDLSPASVKQVKD